MSKKILSIVEVWESLEEHADQEISLRGFLHMNSQGDIVLASEPPLRSCCIRIGTQPFLKLQGNFQEPLPKNAIAVSGMLENCPPWQLSNAHLISEDHSFLALGSVFLIPLLYYARKRLFKAT
jgi:hypothetical protein